MFLTFLLLSIFVAKNNYKTPYHNSVGFLIFKENNLKL